MKIGDEKLYLVDAGRQYEYFKLRLSELQQGKASRMGSLDIEAVMLPMHPSKGGYFPLPLSKELYTRICTVWEVQEARRRIVWRKQDIEMLRSDISRYEDGLLT